jgi:sporulation protein YlmC with PRC-barrel domain
MRKFLISAVSLAALTLGGMAFAEDPAVTPPPQPGTDQKAAQPSTDQSTTTVMPKQTDQTAAQPTTTDQNQAQTTTQPSTTTDQAQTTTQPAAGSSSLTVSGLEPGNVVMASSLIGSTVYSAANENVGDVNDIIIGKDGKVQAVIIGVGGFLGLGEKDVAVPMDRITFAKDENNNMKYTITASRQELEQAPAFDRTKLIVGGGAPSTTGQ